ncbi:Uncharacterised protein [uncultured Eubacterium sp.]|nr:Uncharacterised protein [uncultured Eubacterium sp.]
MSKLIDIFVQEDIGTGRGDVQLILMGSLLFTLCMAGAVALTYRLCHNTLTYNRKFNITLVMLAFLSTVLMTLIQSNPLFSLGVLGSLSICRIRLNTKDPRDLGFVFWAISIGIASSMGAYFASLVSSVVLCLILVISSKLTRKTNASMIVVRGEKGQMDNVQKIFHSRRGISVQSKNIFEESFELVYELHVKTKEEEQLISQLGALEGIHGVNVLAPKTKAA